jgi:hypothetical protein
MPHGDIPLFEHTEILRYEEILTSVRAVVKTEFRKFRLAGGEPLGHKNIFEPIREMLGIDGIEEAMLTTNGARLENKEIDIKFPRRAGCDERRLIDLIQAAVEVQAEHQVPDLLGEPHVQRNMSRIGG